MRPSWPPPRIPSLLLSGSIVVRIVNLILLIKYPFIFILPEKSSRFWHRYVLRPIQYGDQDDKILQSAQEAVWRVL